MNLPLFIYFYSRGVAPPAGPPARSVCRCLACALLPCAHTACKLPTPARPELCNALRDGKSWRVNEGQEVAPHVSSTSVMFHQVLLPADPLTCMGCLQHRCDHSQRTKCYTAQREASGPCARALPPPIFTAPGACPPPPLSSSSQPMPARAPRWMGGRLRRGPRPQSPPSSKTPACTCPLQRGGARGRHHREASASESHWEAAPHGGSIAAMGGTHRCHKTAPWCPGSTLQRPASRPAS